MFGKKFKKYFVINGPYQIQVGQQVEIDEKQAKRRKHVSKHVKGDIYECTFPFQFKAGEIFGFSGEINKRFANIIIDPEVEESDSDVLLEKLEGMSKGQLKYYARLNCDEMKLTMDQDEEEMVKAITGFLNTEPEGAEPKKKQSTKKKQSKRAARKAAKKSVKKSPVIEKKTEEKPDEGDENANTT